MQLYMPVILRITNEKKVSNQIRECMQYANYNEITVVDTYIDRALSAKTDNRPEFQRIKGQ